MYKEETQLGFQVIIGIWGTFPTISILTQIPSSSLILFWNSSTLIKANLILSLPMAKGIKYFETLSIYKTLILIP